MAPLHHHFEKKGWAEPTIVIRFWIIASILALAGPVDAEAAVKPAMIDVTLFRATRRRARSRAGRACAAAAR